MRRQTVVIAGAGHGGVQTAAALRDGGYDGRIMLVGEEPDRPYHRPPLSKTPLPNGSTTDLLRSEQYFNDQEIELVNGVALTDLDLAARTVRLDGGGPVAWDHFVLATGAGARVLDRTPSELDGIHVLRTAADARILWSRPLGDASIVVIGAGFVGLEFAAAARRLGSDVTVVEFGARSLERSVSSITSTAIERFHQRLGTDLVFGEGAVGFRSAGGTVRGVELTSGRVIAADLVLIAVGASPRVDLAAEAGLDVSDGIVVDACLETTAHGVYAIGDCARWTDRSGRGRRLESVQNAIEQATHAANGILGRRDVYERTPWFWSDQADLRLQIAGMADPGDSTIALPTESCAEQVLLRHDAGRLTCVETLNQAGAHLAGRRLIGEVVDVVALQSGATTLTDLARSKRQVELHAT